MKRGDLKKRSSAENRGFLTNNPLSAVLIIFFLFLLPVYPQVPVNGLCRYNSVKVDEGGSFFQTLNYNRDAYTDLAVYLPAKKTLELYTGNPAGKFSKARKQKFNSPITSILPLKDNLGRTTSFILASRSERKIFWGKFTSSGAFITLRTFKLEGYPEFISSADIDYDGNPELVVSGPSLPGLQTLDPSGNKKARTYDADKPYSCTATIDLNSDGYPDVAAYSPWGKKLVFFYNDFKGGLRILRSISIRDEVSNLNSFDMNLDGFPDLLFSAGNSIYTFYGDSAGSYAVSKKIKTDNDVGKFVVGDYNRDGAIDIAYQNTAGTAVNVIFFDQSGTAYPEVDYINSEGLNGLTSFYSKFITGFASLSGDGEIHIISKLLSFQNGTQITFGGRSAEIEFPDLDRDGNADFIIPDTLNKKIKIVTRNKEGYPEFLYSISTKIDFSRVKFNSGGKNELDLVLYSPGKRLYELLNISLDGKKLVSKSFAGYASGGVLSVSAPGRTENGHLLSFASEGNKHTYLDNILIQNGKITANTGHRADSLFEAIDFNGPDSVSFWYKTGDIYNYTSSSISGLRTGKKYPYSSSKMSGTQLICFYLISGFSPNETAAFSIFHSQGRNMIALMRDNKLYEFRDESLNKIELADLRKITVTDQKREGSRRPLIYNRKNGGVYSVGFLVRKNRLILNKIAVVENAENLFPVYLYPDKNFIVCSYPAAKYFSVFKI